MPLIYALAARGSVVLVEHAELDGNFPTVTRLLLRKLPVKQKEKMSYIYDKYIFHYIVVQGITFLTVADDSTGFALPFAFLEEFSRSFLSMHGSTCGKAIALAMQNSYEPHLRDMVEEYNRNPQADVVGRLRTQLDGLQHVLIDNIDKILQRGERIDILVDESERLHHSSVHFRRQTVRLKHVLWRRSVSVCLMFVLLVGLVALIIGMISCGGFTFPSCRG